MLRVQKYKTWGFRLRGDREGEEQQECAKAAENKETVRLSE